MSTTTHNRFPTWMIVVSILILAGPIIWGLTMIFDIVTAMSIGGILVVAALIGLFIWLKKRVGG
jgi:ABC-type nickel/cobalt efflux system permease component RcnA